MITTELKKISINNLKYEKRASLFSSAILSIKHDN